MLNSPRDPESHCCHQLSHAAVVNVFYAVLGAEVPFCRTASASLEQAVWMQWVLSQLPRENFLAVLRHR